MLLLFPVVPLGYGRDQLSASAGESAPSPSPFFARTSHLVLGERLQGLRIGVPKSLLVILALLSVLSAVVAIGGTVGPVACQSSFASPT